MKSLHEPVEFHATYHNTEHYGNAATDDLKKNAITIRNQDQIRRR